ncbi:MULTISPECIES: DUF1652 domain-containing protein [unclassified Pseudomonas]|uniref:DUF1652 domain-containing protein n=1 Tax=unclassified Pseudomonas TaxID=196821 RepID=UPI002AC9E17C|nr:MULTISPECIES: DUF1652 domain-containing protein [unclassified Pseudomonas]MEB0042232.1 DUF1652 domain-containing protein [Pseudomonas sp. MH10]MEB0076478.1 DUF1652 domain-containing protein [Pseudomonas sp. MH10out]MEB0091173.1 DUF1652 domain-containing protein [Pseudomonas sp. CCI4.2]MEB0100873.1 DUF1652 domain-containing protein [Pseudomonas sp. CCI3.2]MEB0119605.1 DUF1652 domain-containing protein [Pseudomonas sp. CCI1.2]
MFALSYLRRCLEKSFMPLACECTLGADASLTVKIFDRKTGRVDLVVTGIVMEKLKNADAIARMIEELHDEMQSNTFRRVQVSD